MVVMKCKVRVKLMIRNNNTEDKSLSIYWAWKNKYDFLVPANKGENGSSSSTSAELTDPQ